MNSLTRNTKSIQCVQLSSAIRNQHGINRIQRRFITKQCILCNTPIPTAGNTSSSTPVKPITKTSRAWFMFKLIAPLAALYYYDRYTIEASVELQADKLISPSRSELTDLIQRASITSHDIIELYKLCIQQYPTMLCTIDEFNTLVTMYITEKYNDLKQSTLQSRTPLSLDTATVPEQLTELQAIDNEHRVEQYTSKPFKGYELDCLYRLSPYTIQKRYNTDMKAQLYLNVLELLHGLAVLCNDELDVDTAYDNWKNQCSDEKLINKPPIRYIQSLRALHHNKLNMNYLFADIHRHNILNRQQLIELINILIRTGHIKSDSLVYNVPFHQRVKPSTLSDLLQYIRTQRVILSSDVLADIYMSNIKYIDSIQSIKNMKLTDVIKQYLSGALRDIVQPTINTYTANTTQGITKSQFIELSQYFTQRGYPLQYWYLLPTIQYNGATASTWFKFKQRVSMNIKSKLVIRTYNQLIQSHHQYINTSHQTEQMANTPTADT